MLLAVTLMVDAMSFVSYATTTQQKIDQAEEDKKKLEGQLDQTQNELENLKGEQNSLKGKLNHLNSELTQVSNNLADLEQQITDKEKEISDTQAALAQARVTEEYQYASMKQWIRYMYEGNEKTYLEAFLTSESIADFLGIADIFERIAAYGKAKMEEYEATRRYIESEEARLQQEKVELDALKAQVEEEKRRVAGLIDRTSESIAKYADEISETESEALRYEAEIKAKEKDLEYLRKKLKEEIAMSQAASKGTWRDISEVTFEEGDRKLLANLIYCEAGGEPYEGKVAVGAVVINRVLSSLFPGTIVGVVYQARQFSPVASGRLELALSVDKANADCYRAADEAMAGSSNVGNCIFFRTPIPGLTGIAIGGHIFY